MRLCRASTAWYLSSPHAKDTDWMGLSAVASPAEETVQLAWAVPPTMQWTWLSEASLDPAYSQPMDDAMVELAGRCF